jgi:hypothetical protein
MKARKSAMILISMLKAKSRECGAFFDDANAVLQQPDAKTLQ